VEVLSPAGNLEKIKYAVMYGADAVYAGSQAFSLRAKADNFDYDDLLKAVEFCHTNSVKLYVPLNIYAHNRHIEELKTYIQSIYEAKIDAVIVSDLGVFELVKNIAPNMPIHVSTQANVTSYQAVKAFAKLGAKRIILARELTFSEIKEIRQKCPDIELEIFIHGAMCISYSGRCLLSAFFSNKTQNIIRSANRGECTQPCRWKYHLIEESRPSEAFSIDEDKHGFYFMNSKDLCLFNRLEEIYQCGIDSVKIEGRMKSLYYISAVTRAYKSQIQSIKSKTTTQDKAFWRTELDKVSHRIYTEAFFDEANAEDTQNYASSTYIRDWQFAGNILEIKNGYALVKSYAKITENDEIEIIFPDKQYDLKIKKPQLFDENLLAIQSTKPNSSFYIKIVETISNRQINKQLPEYGILRLKI